MLCMAHDWRDFWASMHSAALWLLVINHMDYNHDHESQSTHFLRMKKSDTYFIKLLPHFFDSSMSLNDLRRLIMDSDVHIFKLWIRGPILQLTRTLLAWPTLYGAFILGVAYATHGSVTYSTITPTFEVHPFYQKGEDVDDFLAHCVHLPTVPRSKQGDGRGFREKWGCFNVGRG